MKKIFLFIALLLIVSISVVAQKLDAAKVPAAVKKAFAKKFPKQPAEWEKENGEFEAGFKKNGKTMSALFSPDGTMRESEVGITASELPTRVRSYLNSHYKGVEITEAAKITKADGTINYETAVNKKDVLFDGQGNFLKEMKD